MNEHSTTRVVACSACQEPTVQGSASCAACGTALNGKELPYVLRRAASPDIAGMLKWWGIWSIGIWALAGFSFGVTSSLIFTGVSCIYLFRILRAYYN